jgi:hypothetical protein
MLVNHPEKLIPGKFNVIAVGGDDTAILWKDGEVFAVGAMEPWTEPVPISEPVARGFVVKGSMVMPEPIVLNHVSEWRSRAAEIALQDAA